MTVSFLLRWLVLWLSLGLAMRLVFLAYYPDQASAPGVFGFAVGLLHDFMAFWLAPALLSLFVLLRRSWAGVGFFVTNAIILLVVIAEGFFWLEFESRLDRLVFHYLAYPREVIVFLEDQFFLSVFLLPFLLVVALVSWMVGFPRKEQVNRRSALLFFVAGVALVFVLRPLHFASLHDSRTATQFASNGYLGVLGDANYNIKQPPWLPAAPAGTDLSTSTPTSAPVKRVTREKRHVVLIIEESFAGQVWRDEPSRARYLPNFVRLSAQGLSFTNLYATGTRTTRGMEAILNGFPPLPGISTTEREGYERLPSLARALGDAGFYAAFLYGGWPGFSNFSNYWKASGFQRIWSRDDFSEDFETSWGVSDGALFARIQTEMDQLTTVYDRVFLSTLTVSHHRPYDFPDNVVQWDASARSSAHAMAYADQALADFITQAQTKPWYKDTLFVVVADHGLRPSGDQLIPYESFRIPLLVLADGVTPQRFEQPGSNISVPSTVLDLLDLESSERFAGASLLCDCPTPVPLEYGYHVGLLQEDRLDLITRRGKHLTWRAKSATLTPAALPHGHVINYFAPAHRWFYATDER